MLLWMYLAILVYAYACLYCCFCMLLLYVSISMLTNVHMSACMHACIYICVCVWVCAFVVVFACLSVSVHVPVHYTCMCLHLCECVLGCLCACISMLANVHTCACMYISSICVCLFECVHVLSVRACVRACIHLIAAKMYICICVLGCCNNMLANVRMCAFMHACVCFCCLDTFKRQSFNIITQDRLFSLMTFSSVWHVCGSFPWPWPNNAFWQRCKTTMSMLSWQSHPPAPYKHTHIHSQLFRQVAHITKLLEQLSTLESRRCDNNQHGARSLS